MRPSLIWPSTTYATERQQIRNGRSAWQRQRAESSSFEAKRPTVEVRVWQGARGALLAVAPIGRHRPITIMPSSPWQCRFTPDPTGQLRLLLNQYRLSSLGRLLLLGCLLALRVGGALPRGDLVEGTTFRFHPHVGVSRQHGPRDVAGDAHDHLVARIR